jgi:hypothetical protein
MNSQRGQRHRQCGCFAHVWDLHSPCARHWEIGDCTFYIPDFVLGTTRCEVCDTWTPDQWKALEKSRSYSSRKRVSSVSMSLPSTPDMSNVSSSKPGKVTKKKTRVVDKSGDLKLTSAVKNSAASASLSSDLSDKSSQSVKSKKVSIPPIINPTRVTSQKVSPMDESPESLALTPAQLKQAYGFFMSQKEWLTDQPGSRLTS